MKAEALSDWLERMTEVIDDSLRMIARMREFLAEDIEQPADLNWAMGM